MSNIQWFKIIGLHGTWYLNMDHVATIDMQNSLVSFYTSDGHIIREAVIRKNVEQISQGDIIRAIQKRG